METRKRGKARVSVSVETVISFVRSRGIVTEREVCEGLNISQASARGKLEAAVKYRKELVMDDYDAEGHAIRLREDWRYCAAD